MKSSIKLSSLFTTFSSLSTGTSRHASGSVSKQPLPTTKELSHLSSLSEFSSITQAIEGIMEGNRCEPGSDCWLLRMPGEVRNLIYGYALSEPNGLFYRYQENDNSMKLYTTMYPEESEMEANQLKYVCRQLNKETKGLGLKFNNLTFVLTKRSHPFTLKQFLAFATMCSRSSLNQLRRVDLKIDHSVAQEGIWENLSKPYTSGGQPVRHSDRDLRAVIDFCWAHPNVVVNFTVPTITSSIEYWDRHNRFISGTYVLFSQACKRLFTYRRCGLEDIFETPTVHQHVSQARLAAWDEPLVEWLDAPNLRFWPLDETFDEARFRDAFTRDSYLFRTVLPDLKGGLDALVDEVRDWHEYGF